ncbi:7 transmembrane receptor [Dictyocaulus viviparus]|uniref:7 transmembrane receptor n=1 Tax=Dictyocaulus viviparus TaxID=29172 RepID=A0A0D8XE01_DICVI|nr:7 transmembrane receptor [Dictyocaulus viviparus]
MTNFSYLGFPVTPSSLNLGEAIITIASMLTVMLIIILGNLLVVFTVYHDRKLRLQRQNWLIISLALADLFVGLLVMPLTLIYEVVGEWKMGNVLCEIWLALDVLFVTASILHICAISLDRYFSVTSPLTYPAKRTPKRMFIYIGVSWIVSLLICLPPIFGWRPDRRPGECAVSNDVGYVLYSSLGSFYIPVIVLVIVYAKIYSITIKHSRQRLKETERRDHTLNLLSANFSAKQIVEVKLLEENSSGQFKYDIVNKSGFEPKRIVQSKNENETIADKRKRKLKAKERQATLLLGIILSAFILSWLPFFVMYVIGAFGYESPAILFKFFFWLGYCNSGINPVIYTVFNREFKRGLCRQLKKFEHHIQRFMNFYK